MALTSAMTRDRSTLAAASVASWNVASMNRKRGALGGDALFFQGDEASITLAGG